MRSPILEGERPNAPVSWQKSNVTQTQAWDMDLAPRTTNMMSYDLTWHHNIPWSLLRDSWNIIYTFCSPEVVGDLFDLFSAGNPARIRTDRMRTKLLYFKEAIGPSPTNARSATFSKWVDRHGNDETQSHISNVSEEKQLIVDEWDALYSIVAWQAWNIVEGPKESVRTDDPGNTGFDDFRGADQGNAIRFNHVNVMYAALNALLASYAAVKDNWCDLSGTTVPQWNASLRTAIDACSNLKTAPKLMFNVGHWKKIDIHKGKPVANLGGAKDVYWMAKQS